MGLLLIVSFIVGMLTILSPCSITLLPVILGGTVTNSSKLRPYIITASLAISIFCFSFVLQLLSSVISFSDDSRRLLSGIVLVVIGLFTLFPQFWVSLTSKIKVFQKSEETLNTSGTDGSLIGAILTGAALGPVFTTCSPTFGYLLSVIIGQQENILFGLVNIISYILGLSSVMLLVTIFGQWFVSKIKWASNPNGSFKKIMGIIFIIVGLAIIFQFDKRFEILLSQSDFYSSFSIFKLDQTLLDSVLKK